MKNNIANYIVFHPKRQEVNASATILQDSIIHKNWKGNIFVDNVFNGNEDPYIFNNPWLYSYCHASQLRRKPHPDKYIQKGSKIIFVNGNDADKDILTVDTVFIIDLILEWGINHSPLRLQEVPDKYLNSKNDSKSELWERHFKFPFEGHHKNTPYTYEAKLWEEGCEQYSFLPLNKEGQNVSIPFSMIPLEMANYFRWRRKGKYPVLLCDDDIDFILTIINQQTDIKVLRDITLIEEISKPGRGCCSSVC